jgi:hypothetical protein
MDNKMYPFLCASIFEYSSNARSQIFYETADVKRMSTGGNERIAPSSHYLL